MTFVAAYWWQVKPGKEEQCRKAWCRGTKHIRHRYGSLGSRLHRDDMGRFIGVAEWADKGIRERPYDSTMEFDDAAKRATFVDSLSSVERLPCNPDLADQIRHRQAQFDLLLDRYDLLYRKPLPFHRCNSLQRNPPEMLTLQRTTFTMSAQCCDRQSCLAVHDFRLSPSLGYFASAL